MRWGLSTLLFALVFVGCEREKRIISKQETAEQVALASATDNDSPIEAGSWLSIVASDDSVLTQLAQRSPVWVSLLQNDHLKTLELYQALSDPKNEDKIACARSAVELAETAHILEDLLESVTKRVLEIQGTRPGAEQVQAWRNFFSERRDGQKSTVLGAWTSAYETFLASGTAERKIPTPGTATLERRWQLLDRLRDSGVGELPLKKFRRLTRGLAGPDVVVAAGKQQFEFFESNAASLSRLYFAKLASSCLLGLDASADLLRMKALRLEGRPTDATAIYESHQRLKRIALPIQLFTLVDTPDAYAAAMQEEYFRVGLMTGSAPRLVARGSELKGIGFALVRDRLTTLSGRSKQQARDSLAEIDPVRLARSLLTQLNMGADGAQGLVPELVDRYVDAIMRSAAETHYLRGDFPRAAQIRRRIGGTGSFVVGPKVPPSALAACALDHWKIIEPRAAIRYLKDLGQTYPNAKRSADMLRDILSYRARQNGGQTAAGQ